MRSSVATLRELANYPPTTWPGLTPDQQRQYAILEANVFMAKAARNEFLDSLLDRPLTEDERQRIVDDLFQEVVDNSPGGKDDARAVDWAAMSDFELVRDHEAYLEAMAEAERDSAAAEANRLAFPVGSRVRLTPEARARTHNSIGVRLPLAGVGDEVGVVVASGYGIVVRWDSTRTQANPTGEWGVAAADLERVRS